MDIHGEGPRDLVQSRIHTERHHPPRSNTWSHRGTIMTYNTAMALRIVSAVTCGSIIGAGIHTALGAEPSEYKRGPALVPGYNYQATGQPVPLGSYADDTCEYLHRLDPKSVSKRIAVTCRAPTTTTYFLCQPNTNVRFTKKPVDAEAIDPQCEHPFVQR